MPEQLNFSQALEALKAGEKVTRAGRDLYIKMIPGFEMKYAREGKKKHAPHFQLFINDEVRICTFATQDILAEDWSVVK